MKLKLIAKILQICIPMCVVSITIGNILINNNIINSEKPKPILNAATVQDTSFTFNIKSCPKIWCGREWNMPLYYDGIRNGYIFSNTKITINFNKQKICEWSEYMFKNNLYILLQENFIDSVRVQFNYVGSGYANSYTWIEADNPSEDDIKTDSQVFVNSNYDKYYSKSTNAESTINFSNWNNNDGRAHNSNGSVEFKLKMNLIKLVVDGNEKLKLEMTNDALSMHHFMTSDGGNKDFGDQKWHNFGSNSDTLMEPKKESNVDLSIRENSVKADEPDKILNRQSIKYGKFPYGIKYEDTTKNNEIQVPDIDGGFGKKKVVKVFYPKNEIVYFNFLEWVETSGFGDREMFGNIYKGTQKGNYFKFYYDTLELNLSTPEISFSFDLLKEIPNGRTVGNLINEGYISNLKLFNAKDIKFSLFCDTMPRYKTNNTNVADTKWWNFELANNNSNMHELKNATMKGRIYTLAQQDDKFGNIYWSDASKQLQIRLNESFWNNTEFTNDSNILNFKFKNETDNIKNYLDFVFYYPNNSGNGQLSSYTKAPDWTIGEDCQFSGDGSTVEEDLSVLDHTRLICRDNTYETIKETTIQPAVKKAKLNNKNDILMDGEEGDDNSGTISVDPVIPDDTPSVEKTYKALMKLKLNDYYLKQILSGYDVAVIQSKLKLANYAKKVADWTLKFDKDLMDKDNEIWNFLLDAAKQGRILDINRSLVIDYTVPNTNIQYFKKDEMMKFDINYILDNSTAKNFIEFKSEINKLDCPFMHKIDYNSNKNLLDELETLFHVNNNNNKFQINYSYCENYNSMILGQNNSLEVSWVDFLNNGVIIETPGFITGSKPATLRINNIITQDNFDSYEASSKIFGMVKNVNDTRNSIGRNFVIYQHNGEWYDPDDPHDPNNPEYVPDQPVYPVDPLNPDNPIDPNKPDDPNKPSNKPINNGNKIDHTLLIALGTTFLVGGIVTAAGMYIFKRRNAIANSKGGKIG